VVGCLEELGVEDGFGVSRAVVGEETSWRYERRISGCGRIGC